MMVWVFAPLLGFLAISLGVGMYISAPKYKGKRSGHFDGRVFINPGKAKAKGLGSVLRWVLNRKRGPWPTQQAYPLGPAPPKDIAHGQCRVTFVNHTTFLLQFGGYNLLTDPVWSERVSPFQWAGPKRKRPPGIAMDSLPKIHGIIISHNHYDHLDMPSMQALARAHQPQIFVPLGVKAFLDQSGIANVVEMDWWEERPLAPGLALQAVPAQHFSGRGILDRDATLWCGYTLKSAWGHVYFAGDTGYGDFFKAIGEKTGPIRLALLPIGAYKPNWFMRPIHTSPAEAVQIHLDLGAETTIPTHYGTFQLADDGLSEPVQDLQAAMRQMSVPDSAFVVLKEGEGRQF